MIIWSAEEVVALNEAYEAHIYAPRLWLIGSDGAGEAYAVPQATDADIVFRVPFVGLSADRAETVAKLDMFLAAAQLPPSSGPRASGHLAEIQPIIFGGSPSDPSNKALLSAAQHKEFVRYWNRLLHQMTSGNAGN